MAEIDQDGLDAIPELRNRRVTSDYVVDALRLAINKGALPDGAVLNQAALAKRFGVSRVPIREAMKQLQAEGLISVEAHRQAVVRALSIERIVEIYDIRGLLEGYVVERSAAKIDGRGVKRLAEIQRDMESESDHDRWLQLNADFHRELLSPAEATTAAEMANQLRLRGERYVHLWSGGRGIERIADANREHAELVELVAAGDGPGARAALERHVGRTRDELVRQYEAHGARLADGA